MKKAVVLVLVMCLLVISGCTMTGGNTSSVQKTTGTQSDTAAQTEKTQKPAKVVWYWNEGTAQLPDDGYIVKKVKEDLNIEYVHITPRRGDYEEKLQLQLASQDCPDVISSYNTLTTNLIKWGVVQPLEKYMTNEYIPNVIRISYNWETAVKYLTRKDGHVYSIPNCNNNIIQETPFIRYDWLKNLGLEVPKTFEELKEVLIKFTKDDPDQNGKDDTIGTMFNEYYATVPFQENFGAGYGTWYQDGNGGITMGMFIDRHKDFLKYMKELIDTGAANSELGTTKYDNVMEKLKAGKVGFLFTWNDYNHNTDIRKIQPDCDWRPMTPPTGVYDKGYMPNGGLIRDEYCISSQCEDIEAVLRLMNYMANDTSTEGKYDFTGSYWPMKYGEPGVNWEITPENKIDAGNSAKNEAIRQRAQTDTWSGVCRRFISKYDLTWKLSLSPEALEARNTLESYPLILNIPDSDIKKPLDTASVITPDDVAQFNQKWNNVKWPEFFYQAVLGKVDIDQGWEQFVAEAEKDGLQAIEESMLKAFKEAGVLK